MNVTKGSIVNCADAEFYESRLVLAVAYSLSGKNREDFSQLPYAVRKRYLGQSARVVSVLLSDQRLIADVIKYKRKDT